jgi:RES domain-containing protein
VNLHAWRIVKAKYAATAFSGDGARKYGGRWSSPGVAVVYAAGSPSLGMLEILVHVQSQDLLKRYVLFEVAFDEALMTTVDLTGLARTWRKYPPPAAEQRLGDGWISGAASAVLRVPSVISPLEWNYLLNPEHPDFRRIVIGPRKPVQFDPRLIKTTTS